MNIPSSAHGAHRLHAHTHVACKKSFKKNTIIDNAKAHCLGIALTLLTLFGGKTFKIISVAVIAVSRRLPFVPIMFYKYNFCEIFLYELSVKVTRFREILDN